MEITPAEKTSGATATTTHKGSCHCGAVQFEIDLAPDAVPTRCNCTICTKTSQVGSIVKPSAFRLIAGEDALTRYGKHDFAARYFCKHCGVHCYGSGDLPQLGGAFASANWNCLDDIDIGQTKVLHWDGRHDNWQAGPRETPWPIGLAHGGQNRAPSRL